MSTGQLVLERCAGCDVATYWEKDRPGPVRCFDCLSQTLTEQAREIERLREGLDLSWEEAINAVPGRCEGLSVCEPMCHDNIQADLRAARAAAQQETP